MTRDFPKTAAIILAAGSGSRMGLDVTKQTLVILGKSILRRTLEVFDAAERIDFIVVVYREGEYDFVNKECHNIKKPFTVVKGGKCRAESAALGFSAVSKDFDYVIIHDGARCLVTDVEINSVLDGACKFGAATASRAVTDTVKKCDAGGKIIDTVSRFDLKTVQTPQAFSRDIYECALNACEAIDETVTDDNMLVEKIGISPYCVQTLSTNIKITAREDIDLAEYIIKKREEQ